MEELSLLENKVREHPSPATDASAGRPGIVPSDSWKDSPSIQHLIDVISSIIAEEYIMIAEENPEVFRKHGGAT